MRCQYSVERRKEGKRWNLCTEYKVLILTTRGGKAKNEKGNICIDHICLKNKKRNRRQKEEKR